MANSAFQQLADPIITAKSFLTGWKFRTNPWQFNLKDGNYTTVSGLASYACDQTIVQNEESGQVRYRNNNTFHNMFETQTTPAGVAGRVAIIQYIDRSTAAGMTLINEISARVTASVDSGTIDLKMSLLSFTSDTPPLNPITVWDTNPTFDPMFTEIKPNSDPVRTIDANYSNAQYIKFNLLSVPSQSHIAVVVYSTTDLEIGQTIRWEDVSLVRGPTGFLSNPQTADAVLRECEFYYQQSYENGVTPGAVVNEGSEYLASQVASKSGPGMQDLMISGIGTKYRQSMRSIPIHTYYSPSLGDPAKIDWSWFQFDAAGARTSPGVGSGSAPIAWWSFGGADTQGISYPVGDDGAQPFGAVDTEADLGTTKTGYFHMHWVANARLGV